MKKNSRSHRLKDEVKHEAILKAATRLFLKNGYSHTSMDAIADAARVTKQTVYAHYKSKDALFTRMVAQLCEKHSPQATLLADDQKPLADALYEIGLSFINMVTSHEGLAATRLVIAEAQKHPKLAQRYYEGSTQCMVSMMAQFLARQNKRGLLSVVDTASAASYFFALLKGRYYLRMILAIKPLPTVKDKVTHVREVVEIFVKIYGGAHPLQTHSSL
jgi:TetR/AcrR family transcriptional repressor of mexJK operon